MIPPFQILGKVFSIYGIMVLIGIFVAGPYCCKKAKQRGIDVNDAITVLLLCAIGVLVGGSLLYGLTNYRLIVAFFQNLDSMTSVGIFFTRVFAIFGGAVFYGGLIGGGLVGVCYVRHKGDSLADYSDILAPTIPLFHVFGRIGCFLGGCCYGTECAFGFTYTVNPIAAANGVTRFPVQLLEAAINLVIFLVLARLLKENWCRGKLLFLYLASYAVARFILEFFRGDTYRGIFFGLSTSQYISVVLLIFAVVGLSIHPPKAVPPAP